MSSGTGKITQIEEQPSIYQRTDIRKELKLRIARETLNNFSSIFPMNIRDIIAGLSSEEQEKKLA